MREINWIVVHCTATQQNATVSAILRYWTEELGWKNPGYHYLIDKTGTVVQLQEESKVANGVRGYNQRSVHVAYIGGIDEVGDAIDNRTISQKISMYRLLTNLRMKYPEAELLGHKDFPKVHKACPCFDTKHWYKHHQSSLTT